MSDLRKAAQAVIQAWDDPAGTTGVCRALDDLRAALAEPEPAPPQRQPLTDEEIAFARHINRFLNGPCRYPDCVDNGPDGKCTRWLMAECEKSEDFRGKR